MRRTRQSKSKREKQAKMMNSFQRAARAAGPQPSPAAGERARPHLVDGEFQSDKYPTCPRGKLPLSFTDASAQDLIWEYAQRRRRVDAEFSDDVEEALRIAGYAAPTPASRREAGVTSTELAETISDASLRAMITTSLEGRQTAGKRALRKDAQAALQGDACCRGYLALRLARDTRSIVLPSDVVAAAKLAAAIEEERGAAASKAVDLMFAVGKYVVRALLRPTPSSPLVAAAAPPLASILEPISPQSQEGSTRARLIAAAPAPTSSDLSCVPDAPQEDLSCARGSRSPRSPRSPTR